ncbi:MAG: SIMPL domain-containing protein [Muribaculaceae bacterium]|nr:SIMPL domain-containing protein [Muribaculaceae bacterium]
MNKNIFIGSLVVALGLLALGLCVRSGMVSMSNRSRVVSVRGLCEREVEANSVTWPIVTNDAGNDLVALYDRTQKTNAVILDYLMSNGVKQEDITVNSPAVTDNKADAYDPSKVTQRYSLTNVIVVKSNDVKLIRELIRRQTDLLKEGVAVIASNYQYPITYEYTDLNEIKPSMIAEATANAREAAQKFGDDSGCDVGGIITASQGQFSISDRDQFTPFIKVVRVVTYVDYALK